MEFGYTLADSVFDGIYDRWLFRRLALEDGLHLENELRIDDVWVVGEWLLLWLIDDAVNIVPASISFQLKLAGFINLGQYFLLHYY